MTLADRLIAQFGQVRYLSEKLLESFQTPDQWTHQVAPGTNHALWVAGHVATGDNYVIKLIDPDRAKAMADWDAVFGTGSQPTANPDGYPPVGEVLDAMRERRAVLLDLLHDHSDEDLAKSTPEDTPDFCPDIASVFEMVIWHEALHAGQVTVVRRALGHAPVFDAQPTDAKPS